MKNNTHDNALIQHTGTREYCKYDFVLIAQ